VEAGLAFSTEGKARAGMGIDTGDFDGSGKPGVAITNFDNEMIGLYRATAPGVFDDGSIASGIGRHPGTLSDLGACSLMSTLMAFWTWRWPMATSMKPSEIFAATPDTRNRRNSS